MHIPVRITIICSRTNVDRVRDYLIPNKLIHVVDIQQPIMDGDPTNAVLNISGIVFDYEDIPVIKNSLAHYGDVTLIRGKVKLLTTKTILSGTVVAGIVILALFAHSFDEEFYTEVFQHHNISAIGRTLLIIGGSSVAGFLLEMLIIYGERRTGHH